jgi:hypothetical protein
MRLNAAFPSVGWGTKFGFASVIVCQVVQRKGTINTGFGGKRREEMRRCWNWKDLWGFLGKKTGEIETGKRPQFQASRDNKLELNSFFEGFTGGLPRAQPRAARKAARCF